MPQFLIDFVHNPVWWAGFLSWLLAQGIKMLSNLLVTHRVDFSYLVSTGGMPSAHTATVCGLATAIGWLYGCDSALFTVSLAFAILTMLDASTVRYAAGQQARLLNEIVDELFEHHRLAEEKLKELLGHTRLEIFMGMIIGILVGLIVTAFSILSTHS